MNKCLVFALITMTAINVIITTSSPTTSTPTNSETTCTPWLGKCQVTEQCCRDLVCMGYLAKCIPGQIWNDNRPTGDGPFPPQIKTIFI